MRYPLLFLIVLLVGLVVAVSVAWSDGRRQIATRLWVANTQTLRMLPAFRSKQNWGRFAASVLAASLAISLLGVALLAGAPVDRKVENEALARRDLVLCLDASGSMLPYDGQILDRMRELVDQFDGERVALQMWSAMSVIKFALTDDYELIDDVLSEAAGIIRRGYLGEEDDYVLVSPELFEYLEGVDAPDGEPIASLIGDGLASCVLSFDHHDQDRSRTIILATDNEVQGPQIYTLAQAIKFATDQGVRVIGLYPSPNGVLTSEGEQMRDLIVAAGGSFYELDAPGAADSIMSEIQSQGVAEAEGESRVVETDRPRTAALWLAYSSLIALTVLVVRRV